MIHGLLLAIVLLSQAPASVHTETPKSVPRDMPKLVARANEFWAALAGGHRLKALDYVVPDKKEFLLNSGGMPFVDSEVIGVDFETDPNHATIRVAVALLAKDAPGGRLKWVVEDPWVWRQNNWYVDLRDPQAGTSPFRDARAATVKPDQLIKEAESLFKLIDTSVDVGTVMRDEVRRIPIRVEYSGNTPIRIESSLLNSLLALDMVTVQSVTAQSKEIALVLNANAWEGPFTIPLPLTIRYKGVTISRLVTVKGNIFAPLTLTQLPSVFVNTPGQELQLTIRNNTSDMATIVSLSTDDIFELLSLPATIPPRSEAVARLRLKPRATIEDGQRISLNLSQPVAGQKSYDFWLRVRSAP